jgi:cytochrome c-type biogenesis protein
MLFFIVCFVAGIITVATPCVLPLLPTVLGVAGLGNARTKYVVLASLSISIVACTFLLKVSSIFVNVPATVWSTFSAVILFYFGLVYLFPLWWTMVPGMATFNARANIFAGRGALRRSAWGDVMVGVALGPIFSTCSPTYFVILASVLPVSFLQGSVYLAAYVAGLVATLWLVIELGERMTQVLDASLNRNEYVRKGVGAFFMLIAFLIFTGQDKSIELSLLENGLFDATHLEQVLLEKIK